MLIVDEVNDISYCVGNKGKNHAARFRSPNGLVIILPLPKFSDTLTLSQSGGADHAQPLFGFASPKFFCSYAPVESQINDCP